MSFIAATNAEAEAIAAELRGLYARDGWRVTIIAPLFEGDSYRINVSA